MVAIKILLDKIKIYLEYVKSSFPRMNPKGFDVPWHIYCRK